MLSNFFYSQNRDSKLHSASPDFILTIEEQSNGSRIAVYKDLNTVLDPLSSLTYTDFSINQCLKNGVSYKALQISPDLRLGADSDIEEFNSRLESIADQIYKSQN